MVGAGTDTSDLPLYAGHNDLGIAVLLAAMADAKVDRLVLASSMVVYGDGRYRCDRHGVQHSTPRSLADLDAGRFEVACPACGEPMRWQLVDEDAALRPLSAYAASKLAQENYTTAWTRQLPGRAVSLRYHNVYGPGVPADSPYSGVAAIFRSAIARGESPRVFEDGLQMRDFVHVDDVARANLLAIEAVGSLETGRHWRLNVCSGRPVSILDVARILVDESHPGLEARVTGESRPGDVRHIVADPARARAELGFTAQIRPEDGLRAFASDPMRPN
jgi:dTDP-L-rhamnose 4-epimerase